MNPNAEDLLAQAHQQLSAGDKTGAGVSLAAALDLEPAFLAAHNLREQHRLSGNFSDWTGVNAVISPDDDIFRFFVGHPTSRNPLRDYLADGWRTQSELQRVLDLADKSLFRCNSFLEFASGHGRFTRHLAQVLPQGSVTVSDVVPGSVEFLCHHFGVQGFASSTQPSALQVPGRYEVVFVLSLFSHLPDSTWAAWLAKLHSAVAPGGVLVFSTHGEKCAQASRVNWDANGYAFFPSSESHAIDGAEYGTTYTSADYVKRAIATVAPRANVFHLPATFWGNQDAFVVSA